MGRPHDEFFKFVFAAPDRAGELVDLAFSRAAIGSRGRGRRTRTPRFGRLDPELRPLLLDLSGLSESALSRLSVITRSAVHALRWMARKQQRDLRRALAREVLTLDSRPLEAYSTALLTYLDAESTPQEERAILDLVGNSPAREVDDHSRKIHPAGPK